MSRTLRIAVADDEPDMRDYYAAILPRLGHEVVAVCTGGDELVDHCRATRPDLIIADIKMDGIDGIEAADRIYRDRPVPIILVSAYHDPELIERAESDHILAYLVKPIKQENLEPAIAIALHRFEQFEALRREADGLRQALEDRKVIERAKGVLMRRGQLDEPNAFRRLQKLASEKNLKLIALARMILTTDELFSGE